MLFIYDNWFVEDSLDSSVVLFDRFAVDTALQNYSMDIIKNNPESDWKIMQMNEHVKLNLEPAIELIAQGRVVISSTAIISGQLEDITTPILIHLGLPLTGKLVSGQIKPSATLKVSPLLNAFIEEKQQPVEDKQESIIP